MGREQYKTPDADVAAEFDRVCSLFRSALGQPSDRVLFESLMGEANAHGLDWVQGLEYVIEKRLAARDLRFSAPGRRPPTRATTMAQHEAGELLKAG